MSDESDIHHGPDTYPASILMLRYTVAGNPWIAEGWRAVGVTLGDRPEHIPTSGQRVVNGSGQNQYLWSNLSISLFQDETESYYYNLVSRSSALYIVTRRNDKGLPEPFLVTPSFDAGNAYLEGDEEVFTVPMSAEIYRWIEAYVLEYYVPQKKFKLKLNNWKQAEQ